MENRIVLTLISLTFTNVAFASSGMFNNVTIPDQYKCSKAPGKEQAIDVLINGSQRFQGVALAKDGQVLEVSGVIGDIFPTSTGSTNSIAAATATKTKKEWDTFAVEVQLMNNLTIKKLKDTGQIVEVFPMGGFGMGGFGMGGMAGGANANSPEAKDDDDRGPWGSGAPVMQVGGGISGMSGAGAGITGGIGGGMFPAPNPYQGSFFSEFELTEIRKKAADIIDRREAREQKKQEALERKAEHARIFAPPPAPTVPALAPRAGDQLAPISDTILRQPTAGQAAGETLRAGDKALLQSSRNEYGSKPKAGDMAAMEMLPGNIAALTNRLGDGVGAAAGAVIGTANSLTFTARLDPKTGKISQIIYREENKPGKSLNFSENLKGNDPLQGRITQYVEKVKGFAKCCEQDSKSNCDQKYSPDSQAALQAFRTETKATVEEINYGGAIYNPFAGKPSSSGAYGPATVSPAKVKSGATSR